MVGPYSMIQIHDSARAYVCTTTMGVAWFVLPFLTILFAYVDVWYFVRLFLLLLRTKLRSRGSHGYRSKRGTLRQALLSPYDVRGIVLPSDIDYMFHMNNSKYLREMDYGRIGLGLESGFREALREAGGRMVLAAASVRYRRSLKLFQRFLLRTRVLCWDESALYMEQRVLQSDGFVSAIMIAKMAIRGTTVPHLVKMMVGETVESPPFPPEVSRWCESITVSSQSLVRESEQKRVGLK